MNYEIVSIAQENTAAGIREVAYLMDKQAGRLIKVLVEDHTAPYPAAAPFHGREFPRGPLMNVPNSTIPTAPTVINSPVPSVNAGDGPTMVPRAFAPAQEAKPVLPDKPPPAPPPAELAQFFREGNEMRPPGMGPGM